MRQRLTFIQPVTFAQRKVNAGPDHLMFALGALAGLLRLVDVVGELSLPWSLYAAMAIASHLRVRRHLVTWPAIGSVALALVSYGVSALFSATVINQLIAQHWRDAGWKIRNTDGHLGEYSSRFLAVDRLGFSEDDLMDAVVRRHLQPELIGSGEFDAPAAPAARPATAGNRATRVSATTQQD